MSERFSFFRKLIRRNDNMQIRFMDVEIDVGVALRFERRRNVELDVGVVVRPSRMK